MYSGKRNGKIVFVPYDKFENIELVGEGGFIKIYKATWVGCQISYRAQDVDFIILIGVQRMWKLEDIIDGLAKIHKVNVIHRDLHSGNILLNDFYAKICDLGTSKSATELTDDNDDNNEIYGIIPYVAPESRYLNGMIKSAAFTRSLRSQSITSELDFYQINSNNKRKLEVNQSEDSFDNGTVNKKAKPIEDYATLEFEFDIDIDSKQSNDDEYITSEINFDI
ncbi:kinase-like domain-containing protein [Rhizophagus clarus]|uniref:Kinase-like domain-containing protein n=1 Tax=Rhizophagus clarus TaxID=94130 RepID=A0A8H3LDR9_9GLOM|nr:kinase-like domain-containing protein [Rhizophagus clarus]